ncbi:LysR substrate-binding domain-containing protein [Aliamphritea ceti]|uniref:LysR substrate-binding domain-containing protein n=1 Tax=Aliamphritea ceti TaxID=1524258 RepID=UPI0021C3BA85|nr:LysR substrate-binding domain-containing protein [Aliamphritea ceti]
MELKWLEDFLALVEFGKFAKAAEYRCVTQPAFGRRIRSLENWLGVELVDRQQYPTALTETGEAFIPQARQWVDDFYTTRAKLRSREAGNKRVIFAAQHSLTAAFFPEWVKTLSALPEDAHIRLDAHNLHDCLDTLLSGQCDFLLCYHSAHIFPQLEGEAILSQQVGEDRLIPVSAPDTQGQPLHSPEYPGPVALLNYPEESFFGRLIQRDCLPGMDFQLQYENALVEGLKALAISGNGLAWLPEKVIARELQQGSLIRINKQLPQLALKIMLYRSDSAEQPVIDTIWQQVLSEAQTSF